MAERKTTEKKEGENKRLEEIQKKAPSLFNNALLKLSNISELKDVLTRDFLESGLKPDNNRVQFDRNGYKYVVILSRQVTDERLDVDKTKDGVSEGITLWLIYDEKHDESCRLFSGSRGNLDHAVVSHKVFDWNGKKEHTQFVNTQEALDKTSEFISSL
ncbi:MAG: hypothetical protein UT39_C0002G0109 [Candidatus Woesebacteria bacterium GW2011_GWA1_39_21]|uniref:Uncharacterized protein n=1 Tax=Candidatus Woesebacteria bacterium GW2011_GWA1_39_21 TaxID=1618550 RepID=A0A0G0N8Z0_9BACT|nr:MAG: hypothetical protein UT39_C0002G0109 [Candidatus Woesebacteria bacterium GW2011_GWA1_39_21]